MKPQASEPIRSVAKRTTEGVERDIERSQTRQLQQMGGAPANLRSQRQYSHSGGEGGNAFDYAREIVFLVY